MRLAFAIFRYFPFGGLQRDMLAIAQEAVVRGHRVTIFCGEWQGDKPGNIDVVVISARLFFDVGGVKSFVHGFRKLYQPGNFDALIGFNKMPGLDFYFAGDSCFAQKAYGERGFFYRLTPRARLYLDYENAVFGAASKTRILSVTAIEQKRFAQFYSTGPERFHALPPGIDRQQFECKYPDAARKKIRAEFGINESAKVILCLGSGFKTKGLDRSIAAFAQVRDRLPQGSVLLVVGADNPARYIKQAKVSDIAGQVKFVGGRSDIADIFQAADVLLHPAYRELAGNVILESMLAGKPVITTDVCGFAHYVSDASMGIVISAPYSVPVIAAALEKTLHIPAAAWRMHAERFSADTPVFSRQRVALEAIENNSPAVISAREWIASSSDNTIILRDELITAWAGLDIIDHVGKLSGSVARELADRQTLRFELNGRAYYRKLHRGVGWWEIIKNLLQCRLPVVGARNEWDALNKLHAVGIPSLEPVAYGEQHTNPAQKKSFIVTRELAGVVQLDDYFQQQQIGFVEKQMLLQCVAKISRNLHEAGINHRDFYLCHFMLKEASMNSASGSGVIAPVIFLMDLHRAQIRLQVPRRWLVKDLSGLYFSSLNMGFTRNDYFRFMCAYWQLPLRDILRTNKALLTAIAQRAIKTYQRDFGVIPGLPVGLLSKY